MNIDHITDITIHFNDPEWILEHITIGLQASSDGDIIKSPCDLDGIEQYLVPERKALGYQLLCQNHTGHSISRRH